MNGHRTPQDRTPRPKGKTPAERGQELLEAQRQLKQEAADRRDAAKAAGVTPRPPTRQQRPRMG